MTRGEIRKKQSKPKPADAPVDLGFISSCTERIDALDLARLDQAQKDTLKFELGKLRGFAYQKLKY